MPSFQGLNFLLVQHTFCACAKHVCLKFVSGFTYIVVNSDSEF